MLHRFSTLTRILIYALFGISLMGGGLLGCKCTSGDTDKNPPKTPKTNSANLLLSGVISDDSIRAKIVTAVASMTTVPKPGIDPNKISIRRCPCDSALLNITLPAGWTITGVDGDPVAVKPPTGGESRNVDLPIMKNMVGNNFPISSFVEKNPEDDKPYSGSPVIGSFAIPTATPTNPAIKIAIFDSGLDETFVPATVLRGQTSLCLGAGLDPARTSVKGWDFMPGGTLDNPFDNHPHKHGSRVAYLTARQFNKGRIPVSITPFKVLNEANQGDLFGLICAMETARKNNFKVFNMSLGYYGAEDAMLKAYVKRAIDDKIWIVAAAGNHYTEGGITPTDTTRDLSVRKEKFYPAWFAKDFSCVLAATTAHLTPASALISCAQQNYDQEYVVGVKEDSGCRFNVFAGSPARIFGTSYAAPVLTGWLGVQLHDPANAAADRSGNRAALLNLLPRAVSGSQLYQNRYVVLKPMP
jgi:hypothetical protein